MSYNEVLKNDNFDTLSGLSNSYYDEIFCPNIDESDKVFTAFPKHNYKGIKNTDFKELEVGTGNFYDCRTKCELKNKCTGYAIKMGNQCHLYGSYPKPNELVPNANSDFYLKKNVSYDFKKLNNQNQKRIRKYCEGNSVRNLYQKINQRPYDGIEKCVKNIKKNKNKGYIDLNMNCVWETLKKPIKEKKLNFNNNNLGGIIQSEKLGKYKLNWIQSIINNNNYNRIENELSIYDKPEYFPEYYKTLDENYARVDDLSGIEIMSGVNSSPGGDVEENFVVKGGPQREQLAKVQNFGCNNVYFILLIIPVLLLILIVCYKFGIFGSKNGKNKNL